MGHVSRRSLLSKTAAYSAAVGTLSLPRLLFAMDQPLAAPDSVGLSSARLELLDRKLQGFVDQGRRPGIVALIARRGKIAFHRAYGWANIGAGIPMATGTIMRQASMTKPLTAVAMMMLYEQGKFQLFDPVEKYIPEFAGLKVFAGRDAAGELILEEPRRKPTMADLFRHTAGFTYGEFPDPALTRRWAEENPLAKSQGEFVKALAAYPLAYHPGEQWLYSVSHDVLGYLIELLGEASYPDFLHRRIFDPLGMDSSFVGIPPERFIPRLSALYARNRREDGTFDVLQDPVQGTQDWYGKGAFGGSGLWSTARDYNQFAQMLLNGGALGGARLLSPVTVAMMTRDQLPAGVEVTPYPGEGFGLGVQVMRDLAKFGHLGSVGEYGWGGSSGTYYIADPKEQMVALWMTQGRPHDHPARLDFYNMAYAAIVE